MFGPENFRFQNNFDPYKMINQKKYLSWKIGSKNFWVLKKFGPFKNIGFLKFLGPKKLRTKKIWIPKKFKS